MNARAAELIRTLGLRPHPEGGHYAEVFRSGDRVHTQRGERSALTTIDFLLARGEFSAWHRVVSAGAWQAAEASGDFAYVGATVGPGFEFADFSFGRDSDALRAALPELAPQLSRLL